MVKIYKNHSDLAPFQAIRSSIVGLRTDQGDRLTRRGGYEEGEGRVQGDVPQDTHRRCS
jgi:hypothetical protein